MTLNAEDVARAIPHLPDIALVRTAKFNRKGGASVTTGALHGSATFQGTDMTTILRLAARFPGHASKEIR